MALRVSAVVALVAAFLANAAQGEDCSLPFCQEFDGHQVRCENPSMGQYFPHPTDCHQYIRCSFSGMFVMACPPGTAWDQDLRTCAHEATVASCKKVPDICDCDCCFRADPDDVAGFVYCYTSAGGAKATPYKLRCPEGRKWDDSTVSCV
ncbi:uncharacterized protein LOC119575174 [Penaeus monodon]|uniref:uncharacterized protein LOC119575174 n=1 Tax=Penaeus monodon TaxID=6687 RepID=UPI0018A7C986|nr:uncharacterized protein LOC119575174 [Penaeus monodon]